MPPFPGAETEVLAVSGRPWPFQPRPEGDAPWTSTPEAASPVPVPVRGEVLGVTISAEVSLQPAPTRGKTSGGLAPKRITDVPRPRPWGGAPGVAGGPGKWLVPADVRTPSGGSLLRCGVRSRARIGGIRHPARHAGVQSGEGPGIRRSRPENDPAAFPARATFVFPALPARRPPFPSPQALLPEALPSPSPCDFSRYGLCFSPCVLSGREWRNW